MHLAALVNDVDVALGIAVLANELCRHLALVEGGEEGGVGGDRYTVADLGHPAR
jgi:hypothetical protein